MKNYIILILLIAFFSCKEKNKSANSYSITQIEYNNETDYKIEDIISDIHITALVSTTESLFKSITQIEFVDKEIFILDMYTNSLLVFNNEGDFIRKLCKVGQGPGEYSLACSFTIDRKNKHLYVVDSDIKTICYDLHSFDYISENKNIGFCISILENGGIAGFNFVSLQTDDKIHDSHLLIADHCFNIIKDSIPILFENGVIMTPTNRFYKYNEQTYVFPPFDNKIYKIENGSIIPWYEIYYGNYTLAPLDFLKANSTNNYIKRLYETKYVRHFRPFETNDYLIMSYHIEKDGYIGIYQKQTKKNSVYPIKNEGIEYSLLTDICGIKDECLVAYTTLDKLEENSFFKLNNQFKELSGQIEKDAPVLVTFKLSIN